LYNFQSKNTYTDLISVSRTILIKDGNKRPECKLHKDMSSYNYNGSFYAINPMMRPIPVGTILICIKVSIAFPYNSISISVVSDMYKLYNDCVYMIVWGQRVPYTVPFYIYTNGSSMHLSYINDPPGEKWEEDLLSPIYVLPDIANKDNNPVFNQISSNVERDFKIDKYRNPIYTFKPNQGRCIPSPSGYTLEKCEILSNPTVTDPLSKDDNSTPNLLNIINSENKKYLIDQQENIDYKYSTHYIFRKIKPKYIGLILLIFTISFLVCIIILLKIK
jgi:hypothetical protein